MQHLGSLNRYTYPIINVIIVIIIITINNATITFLFSFNIFNLVIFFISFVQALYFYGFLSNNLYVPGDCNILLNCNILL